MTSALQLSRQGGVDVPVDQVDREHREDREREGDHYRPGAFDLDGFGQDAPVEPDERLDTPPFERAKPGNKAWSPGF